MCICDDACGSSIITMEHTSKVASRNIHFPNENRDPRERSQTTNQFIHQKIQKSISLVLPYYVSVEYSLHKTMSSSSRSEDDD